MSKPRSANTRSADEWAAKFDALLDESRRKVFEIGDALIEAEKELTKKGFVEAIKKSGIRSKTTALNYMRVAESALLRNPDMQKHLPTAVGTLIDLAAWRQEDFAYAIQKGALNPNSKRSDLAKWRHDNHYKARNLKDPNEALALPEDAVTYAFIKVDPKTMSSERQSALNTALSSLEKDPLFSDLRVSFHDDLFNNVSSARETRIINRLRDAFYAFPEFKAHAFLRQFWTSEGVVDVQSLSLNIKVIAAYISGDEFLAVQKALKFTEQDWATLGVTETVGHRTVMSFLQDSGKSDNEIG